MGRAPCCEKEGLKRGPWTYAEDVRLIHYIQIHGEGGWRALPKAAGLLRCGKSCRLRWFNYLRPDLKRGKITEDEESLIIKLHSILGNRWSLISGRLPGRTDNEIKNHWNAHLKKRLRAMGINPETHQPLDRQLNCEPIGITDETIMQENTSAFNSSTTKAMARVQFKGIDATERIAMENPNQTFSPVNISIQAKVCKEDITNLIHAEGFCASPDSATTQMHTLTDSSTYLSFDRPTAAREEEMMDVYSSHSMTKDEEFWSLLESELIWEMEMRHAVAIAIPIGSPTGNLDAGASADLWGAGDMVFETNPDPPWLNWESY